MTALERLAGSLSAWAPVAVLALAGIVGSTFGLGPALLVVAAGVLTLAITLFWSSLGRLTGESPLTLEEAIGLGAPSAEEERKRSILRALKDLEYERSVGKISEGDFAELAQRYRAEAKVLLQAIAQTDAPRRKKAEMQLEARLKKEGLGTVTKKSRVKEKAAKQAEAVSQGAEEAPVEPEPQPAEPEKPVEAKDTPPGVEDRVCESCQTKNDPDARFCKRCGATLGEEEAS